MGSFSQLTIADYPIFSNKNGYFQEIVNLLFLPDDFIKEERKNSTRNKLVWGDAYENEKGTYTFRGYKQIASVCKQRLEIFGMTLQKAKKDFPSAKKIALKEDFYSFPLSKVSFTQYLSEVSDIINKKEINYNQLYTNLRDSLITGELGIFGQSLQSQLYSILSSVPENSIVEYDLTDVIYGGWVKEKEVKQITIEKILVLTEGKTDVEFISATLKKLHPFLHPYYHFIDFDEYKVESNASALVKLVISLAASNIKHPIIVLFDNDTTGIMEMNKLKSVQIGENFKILKLPDIQTAKKYPTIGPTGIKKMNVNGLACGIEMYLGKDTLTKDGKPIPVHWRAYNEKEKKYQGDISEKSWVQDTFRQKLKSNSLSDFSDLEQVLKAVFTAFQ
ncbi:HEPN/Toprim-associated domain-containing protein [Flectobacillus roseus]|uniref:HEPN/Toprim-associated domain-containing protein n=1 Tax=Flectobacillus roseus TaxID=502259 RepID=UPI0024B7E657|nr:HEPN/Toprim-associated domain-containing protein [Flectobacillus roseus]MDI9872211.1 HEPN/Toprim-associated domain-containing protein [Flectobacillus roseus]